MANAEPEIGGSDGAQAGSPQAAVPIWWQVVAILVLAMASPIFAKLLALALDLEARANFALPGFILAVILISVTAPRSLMQLGVIMAVVALGGALANLTGLVIGNLATGLWIDVLATVLSACLGAGFVVLAYRFLRVPYRQHSPENRA